MNVNKDTQGLCCSRVWEEHSPKCSDINFYSSGNKGIQKGSVNVNKDESKGSVAKVDMTDDTVEKCYNLRFIPVPDRLANTTLEEGPGMTVDTAPGGLTSVTLHEESVAHFESDNITAAHSKSNKLQEESEPTLKENYGHEEHSNNCHGISTLPLAYNT